VHQQNLCAGDWKEDVETLPTDRNRGGGGEGGRGEKNGELDRGKCFCLGIYMSHTHPHSPTHTDMYTHTEALTDTHIH